MLKKNCFMLTCASQKFPNLQYLAVSFCLHPQNMEFFLQKLSLRCVLGQDTFILA